MKKTRLLKKWFRGEWGRELRHIKGNPGTLSLSFALGIFIGFTPTIGFQTLLCYGVTRLLKKSFLISVAGSSLVTGIPVLIPAVYYGEYRLGARLLRIYPFHSSGHFTHPINFSFLISLGRPLLVGSILLAITGGLLSYVITFVLLKLFKKEQLSFLHPKRKN